MTAAVAREYGGDVVAVTRRLSPRPIAGWLFDGGAQLRSGPEAGGVAGWLTASGEAVYVYPEISGYYLQWLAWRALRQRGATAALRRRASSAQRWLRSWVERGELPPTRIYLREHQADWRNDAVFFFDVAMVVRGVASAVSARLIEPDFVLVGRLAELLLQLVGDDGQFDACVTTQASPLPERWSTRRGGFLAKAAAGVLCAAKVLPHIATLQSVAETTLEASLRMATVSPHAETHPLLYAIEGALSVPGHQAVAPLIEAFTAQVDVLLQQTTPHGELPESRFRSGIPRLDIVAQTLRAASLLQRRAHRWCPDPLAMERMRQGLARHVTHDGALPIDPTEPVPQYNVWCAMFADQALQVAQHRDDGPSLDDLETCLV
ncbi:MAG: hypothetical protein ABI537_08155 [Casimicrobiaceae bacterium]